jgi:hypothetical protein
MIHSVVSMANLLLRRPRAGRHALTVAQQPA